MNTYVSTVSIPKISGQVVVKSSIRSESRCVLSVFRCDLCVQAFEHNEEYTKITTHSTVKQRNKNNHSYNDNRKNLKFYSQRYKFMCYLQVLKIYSAINNEPV